MGGATVWMPRIVVATARCGQGVGGGAPRLPIARGRRFPGWTTAFVDQARRAKLGRSGDSPGTGIWVLTRLTAAVWLHPSIGQK